MEHNKQLFEFIIVIDFEATCDQAQNPTVSNKSLQIYFKYLINIYIIRSHEKIKKLSVSKQF
jgi:hypothetical protein